MEVEKILEAIEISKQETKNTIQNSEEKLLQAINKTNTRVNNLEAEIEALKIANTIFEERIESQQAEILSLERKLKIKNLVVYGIKEETENREKLENIILKLINEKLNIPTLPGEIDLITRLGKQLNKNRPILITLTTEKKKFQILKARSLLKQERIYIDADRTTKERNSYKNLKPFLIEAKQKGLRAVIKNEKLWVNNESFTEEQLKSDGLQRYNNQILRRKSPSLSALNGNNYGTDSDPENDEQTNDNIIEQETVEVQIHTNNVQNVRTNEKPKNQRKGQNQKNEITTQHSIQRFLRSKHTPKKK